MVTFDNGDKFYEIPELSEKMGVSEKEAKEWLLKKGYPTKRFLRKICINEKVIKTWEEEKRRLEQIQEEEKKISEKKTKKCPYCAAEIKKDAKKCRYCGEWFTESGGIYQAGREWTNAEMAVFVVGTIILPIVGIVAGIIGLSQSGVKKGQGGQLLAIGVAMMLVWYLILYWWLLY